MRIFNITLRKHMICSCGNRDLINPEYGETMERYMARKICRNCNTRGNWKEENEEKAQLKQSDNKPLKQQDFKIACN